MNIIKINEEELTQIIRKEIKNILSEGIDIPSKRTISVNNEHQKYVDTNNYKEPYLFTDNQRGYKTISIFQRKSSANKIDSNPLLNALKNRKGWRFQNAKQDLMKLLRNFVAAAKLLPKYDIIIMTPSNNELNRIVFDYLVRLIKHDKHIEDFFEKMTADDVYSCMIDDDYIEQHYPNKASDIYDDIDDAFIAMNNSNNGIFSYKYLQKVEYRDIIMQSMKIKDYPHCKTNYENVINDKNVLVFDDTITTGKTISDSGKAIKDMFNPKSITYITLFSAIPNEGTKMQKVNNIK